MSSDSPPQRTYGTSMSRAEALPEEGALDGASGGGATPTTPSCTLTVESELNHIGFGRFQALALVILGLANASDAVELLCLSFILPVLDGSGASNKRCGGVDAPLDQLALNSTLPGTAAVDDAAGYTSQAKALLSAGIFIGMLVGGLVFGVAADRYGRRVTLCASLAINAGFGLLSALTPQYGVLLFCRVMAGFGVGGSIPGVFTLAAELLPAKDRGFWLSTVAWWWMVGSIYAAGLAWLMLGIAGLHWQWYAAVCTFPAAAAAALIYALLPESPRFMHGCGDVEGASRALIAISAWNGRTSRLSQGWALDPVAAGVLEGAEGGEGRSGSPGGAEEGSGEAGMQGGKGAAGSAAATWAQGVSGDGGEAGSGAVAKPSLTLATRAPAESEAQGLLGAGSSSGSQGSSSEESGRSTPSKHKRTSMFSFSVVASGRGGGGGSPLCLGMPLPSNLLGTVRQMFSPEHMRISITLSYVWFALSFGWYGLILWIPTLFCNANVDLDEFQDSFLVAASNLPGNLLSALLMDRVGRKAILTGSLIAACCAAIGFRYAKTEVTVVLAACMLNAVSTCSWNSLDCLSTESYPTALRTTALGLLAAMGRLGSIAGQFVFGSLVDGHTSELLILSGVVLGTGALASMALPRFEFKE